MRQASTIDLTQLPPPALIEALDAESYVAAALADYRRRFPEFTAVLESEPVLKLIEVFAYRETLLRNRVNKAALSVMLAYAALSDLDQLGALYEVERMARVDAPRPYATNPEDWEDDARYLKRIQLAPESFSVAGPPGAYEYHALSCDIAIVDAHAWFPDPGSGKVDVVLAGAGGEPLPDETLWKVIELFAQEDVVPGTDIVNVRRAARLDYTVDAVLQIKRGPDPATVRAEAVKRAEAYAAECYAINGRVYRAGPIAALKVGGVDNVVLGAPAADVIASHTQIPFMVGLNVETEAAS